MSLQPSISAHTQICAVIGNPVAHSLSPAIHNAAFAATGLDFVYLASQVDDVKNALAGMRALGNFRGLSITIPHKVTAIQYVDEVSDCDRSIGSINTVIHEGNRLLGFSTDGPGALKALTAAGVSLPGKHVMMLGSGGAARAIAFTLARETGLRELTLRDVNETMLRNLTADLQAGTTSMITAFALTENTLAATMERADIIIHCTPIGMFPNIDASIIPPSLFRPSQVVFDIVYTPLETKLLREARRQGCMVIPGVEMFINQAVLQFERFTGVAAPVAVMRRVVLEHLPS
jgi:shikimate dehydrogenase